MRIFAYPEIYKETAADNLGIMFDYGVNCCGLAPDELMGWFVESGDAHQFECGSPRVLRGMSGTELCWDILRKLGRPEPVAEYPVSMYRSPEYWAGWVLAQYQWYSNQKFEDIQSCFKFSDLVKAYYPLHEAHEQKTFRMLDGKMLAGGFELYNRINDRGEIEHLKELPQVSYAFNKDCSLEKERGL